MSPWIQAIVLGIVQGATEFIPVSSSAHLALLPYLAGWEHPGLAFDVALHLGTAAAVILFFRRELFAMARGLLGGRDEDSRIYRRLALFVAVATIPVAVAGFFLEDLIGDTFEQPLTIAGLLLLTAALLFAGEHGRTRRVMASATQASAPAQRPSVWRGDWIGTATATAPARTLGTLPTGDDSDDPRGTALDGMTLRQALTIGIVQTAALLPGISRSGSTISAGMLSGMTREAAARFSFLLSLPALLGAFVLSLPDLSAPSSFPGGAIAAGVVASFVSGYIAVRFLVRLVARDRLSGFARYCIFLAVVTLIAYQFLGPPSAV